jgi:predicted transcriptional regulator of viral defense system
MQNINKLNNALENLSDNDHYIFSVSDFYQLFPKITPAALKMLLSRAAKNGILERICLIRN